MSENVSDTSRQVLIDDLKRLIEKNGKVTRDYYREHGAFSEKFIAKYFTSFKEFVASAGEVHTVESELQEWQGNTWTVTLPKTHIHTLDELLEHCKVDKAEWIVEKFTVNQWQMGSKDSEGNVVVTPLFQVKATLIKRIALIAAKNELESLKSTARNVALIPTPVIRTNRVSGNMLEIALFDAHFGKLAWGRETGGPDYDIKIAQSTFLEAVEKLLDLAKGFSFDSVLFVVGNDLLNSDDLQGRTTKGTTVSTDTRYQKTFEVVRETITKCIERFRQIAPVTVKMVQGNHDELSVWHLGDSLSCLFKNYDDVIIDNSPMLRKYHQWGNCGLLFTHGDKAKRADFPLLFATERPDIFGSTKYREVHTGHYHQTKTEEFHGVRVRIIPSLSPADNWHSQNGFVSQQRVGEAYVFNKTEGLLAQFYYNAS